MLQFPTFIVNRKTWEQIEAKGRGWSCHSCTKPISAVSCLKMPAHGKPFENTLNQHYGIYKKRI